MAKITYDDKISINENADIPAINKCQASDMNEIKQVVNENDDKIEALQPNIITAIVGEYITFSSTTTINDLSLVEHSKVGSAFTLENGKITVGAGVNNVILSGQIRIANRSSANGVYNIYIYKNDEIVTAGRTAIVGNGLTVGASVSSFVTEVAEGDVLKLAIWKPSDNSCEISSANNGSFLTVEKAS